MSLKKWLTENHIDANTPVGDLAREIASDDNFPEGGRRAVLAYLTNLGADAAVFDAVERACALAGVEDGDYDEPPAVHEFVVWLMQQGNPVFATFAATYGDIFPATGSREALRAVLVDHVGEDDILNLTCFDVAWAQFRPKCEVPHCNHPVGQRMSLCAVHAPLQDLL